MSTTGYRPYIPNVHYAFGKTLEASHIGLDRYLQQFLHFKVDALKKLDVGAGF
jgi:hypothetical protein